MNLIAAGAALAVLAGCGGSDDDAGDDAADGTVLVTEPVAIDGTPSDGDVPWENYDPSVRTRIAALFAGSDCGGLQGEFDIADATNEAQATRTGENNARLMTYLDQLLRAAACY